MTTTRELTTTAGEGNSRQPSLHSTVSARHAPEVSIPASTGRRKTRFVRDEGPPDDLVVVVRAAGYDIDGTLADMVRDARYSGESYALEGVGGDREALFGVSVFAVERDSTVAKVLEKFSASPRYLAVTVGQLRAAGFPVLPTGTVANHFDIQLVSGIPADVPARFVDEGELVSRAATVVELAGPLLPNPAYTGQEPLPEER